MKQTQTVKKQVEKQEKKQEDKKKSSYLTFDLDYDEDSNAETDANFVLTGNGKIVEIQGTAEEAPFSEEEFIAMLRLAQKGCAELKTEQENAVKAQANHERHIPTYI